MPKTSKGSYSATLHEGELVLPAPAASQYRAEHAGYGQRRESQGDQQGVTINIQATINNDMDVEELAWKIGEIFQRRGE